jgi:hypothetical protein
MTSDVVVQCIPKGELAHSSGLTLSNILFLSPSNIKIIPFLGLVDPWIIHFVAIRSLSGFLDPRVLLLVENSVS